MLAGSTHYRVFEYGCGAFGSPDKVDLMLDEMRRRQKLWNRLVKIEREYRAKVRELLSDAFQPPIDHLSAVIDALRAEIKQRRRQARTRKVGVADLQAAIAGRAERATLMESSRAAREQIRSQRKQDLAALESARKEQVKTAYQQSNCYGGNYNDEVAAYNSARAAAIKAGVDLRLRRWTGEGKITVLF